MMLFQGKSRHMFRHIPFSVIIMAVALAALTLVLDISTPFGVVGGVPCGLLVLLGVWFPTKRHVYALAIICTLLTIVGFFASSHSETLMSVLANRALRLAIIWAATVIICSRKEVKHALEKSENRFKMSQTFANIGTWDWNIKSGDLYWSDRIPALFGGEEGNMETSYDNFVAAIHPEDREMVVGAINSCIENNDEYDIEHRVIWPDGSIHWLHESGDMVHDEDGNPANMLGVVQDVTAKKDAEVKIILAKEEADRANKAKSEFLSSMSHELRTPLNAILGFGQMLELDADTFNETQQGNVKEIIYAGNHLLTLINEVLDLAKIESGKLDIVMEKVDFDEVLEKSVALIEPLAAKRNIELSNLAIGKGYIVCADKVRLTQVLVNILSNAVKYNHENGHITIKSELVATQRLRISITDSGGGISKQNIDKLFNPFERLDAKNNVEGSGIGLVICKSLMELMGGTIGVKSTLGEGSTFWVEIALTT